MRKGNKFGLRKGAVPSWEIIGQSMERLGWSARLITKNKFILENRNQRIETKRIPSINKWKVEHFEDGRVDDSTGIEDERSAKMLTIEMATLRSF